MLIVWPLICRSARGRQSGNIARGDNPSGAVFGGTVRLLVERKRQMGWFKVAAVGIGVLIALIVVGW